MLHTVTNSFFFNDGGYEVDLWTHGIILRCALQAPHREQHEDCGLVTAPPPHAQGARHRSRLWMRVK